MSIDHGVEAEKAWVNELMEVSRWQNREQAYAVTRIVMQSLRDRPDGR